VDGELELYAHLRAFACAARATTLAEASALLASEPRQGPAKLASIASGATVTTLVDADQDPDSACRCTPSAAPTDLATEIAGYSR
jgi:hypothetical protein